MSGPQYYVLGTGFSSQIGASLIAPVIQPQILCCGFPDEKVTHSNAAKLIATYENRTRPKCLEGIYANHYTNAAVGFGDERLLLMQKSLFDSIISGQHDL